MLSTKKKVRFKKKKKENTTKKKVRNQGIDHAIDQEKKQILRSYFFSHLW